MGFRRGAGRGVAVQGRIADCAIRSWSPARSGLRSALERAWERWRVDAWPVGRPMPPVSSYVGYSIEEPWGRPRVVFGVDAREAELLAALLDHHECVGPFYQGDPSDAGRRGWGGAGQLPARRGALAHPGAGAGRRRAAAAGGGARTASRGAADGGPDGLAGDGHGDEPRYPDRRTRRKTASPNRRARISGGPSGRPADHRRGGAPTWASRAAGPAHGLPAAVGRGPRDPMAEVAGADAMEHDADGFGAEASWPPDVPGLSWPDEKAEPAGAAPASEASGAPAPDSASGSPAPDSTAVDSTTMDSTTVDSIPVQEAPAAPDSAAQDERAARGRSLYDVTKASRDRRRDAGRGRGAGQVDRRQSAARDLGASAWWTPAAAASPVRSRSARTG